MAYVTQLFYCSGTTEAKVGVTMTEEICPHTGTIYDDGYCVYETHRKELTFTLNHAVDFNLRVYFNVDWEQTVDSGTPSSGTQAWSILIPAGLTVYTWSQYDGQEWRCEETRTCYSEGTGGEGDGEFGEEY